VWSFIAAIYVVEMTHRLDMVLRSMVVPKETGS
jgi:hypothetical protein